MQIFSLSSKKIVAKLIFFFQKIITFSLNSILSLPDSSPKTPGGAGATPLFKFTDPALSNSASTVKDRLLYWCQVKTKEYKVVQVLDII